RPPSGPGRPPAFPELPDNLLGVTGGSADRPLPLTGLRVLDLGRIYQGPWCGTLLALAGATVIKVEAPGGEPARGANGGPTAPVPLPTPTKAAIPPTLRPAGGRGLFPDRVRAADVVVENFGRGVMERLGVGAERLLAVTPRLIYGASTAYGVDG